ncbi:MAG: hypothetical protein ABEH78_10695 [Haloferacaceae archaeon]
MPDTKGGRDEQARAEERRQRERELAEARERGDESEPAAADEERDGDGEPPTCDRRGCDEPAAFVVLERYQEGSGHGAVEAEARLCRTHAAEESPTNLEGVYPDYVFRVEPLPRTVD